MRELLAQSPHYRHSLLNILEKETRSRKTSTKYVCKTLPQVGIRLAVLSLKPAALILHVGRQHLPAEQTFRERQTRVSMLILDGPLNIDRASNKAFPRQFYLPEPETFCSSFELQCFCKLFFLFFLSELFMNLFFKIAAVVQLLGTTDISD